MTFRMSLSQAMPLLQVWREITDRTFADPARLAGRRAHREVVVLAEVRVVRVAAPAAVVLEPDLEVTGLVEREDRLRGPADGEKPPASNECTSPAPIFQ